MTEPDVTLSDYALFVECIVFAWLILRTGTTSLSMRRWTSLFFAFTAIAALLGGTVHGFFVENQTLPGRVLWKGSLLSIGAAALAAWGMGAHMRRDSPLARAVTRTAAIITALYSLVVIFVSDAFSVAIAGYLPAALFLLASFASLSSDRTLRASSRLGIAGLLLTFAAAFVQQSRIALHSLYFNHNALYHLVQAVAVAMIFFSCRRLLALDGGPHADEA
ncbi:MAG: hypothetical protein AB7F99_12625 [Vicinamibacterales bacterium]